MSGQEDIEKRQEQTIEAREAELIEEFEIFDEPMDRYEYLIDLGKKLPPLGEVYKVPNNLVKGCQSSVWLHSKSKNGTIVFNADSNTVITKGLIALLVRVLSGLKSSEIQNADLGFIDAIGLRAHLSSQRSNGLNAMIQTIKGQAAYLASKS
jgi:cysteine desulfuration protein SufE